MLNMNRLNLYASRVLSGNLLDTYTPFEGNLDECVQLLPKSEEVFSLCLVSGKIKNVEGNDPPADTNAIVRVPISYLLACRMSENENMFNYHILNIVNMALCSLTKKYGSLGDGLNNKLVTCARPTDPNVFFRDMENSAAVELRFFVNNKE